MLWFRPASAPPSSRRGSCGFGSGETRNVKPGGELVWVDMLMVDVNVTHIYIYIYDVYFKLRYRVEMAIADDTAAGTFVWFDGVMKKLHNLRANVYHNMIYEATFQKETTILIFSIVDELGRVRDDDVGDNGGNEDDDDNMPNGKPAPVGFASGRATGNGSDGSIRYCA
uniref:Replication factor A C-terminal domain-containing protein n=1 Tax=Brassica campestris TaxID=3711 RepID=M4CEV2_BRACM